MEIMLSLSAAGMDDDDLQEMTRQICGELRDEGVQAALATQPANPDDKSGLEIELLGKIVLAAIGAGGPIVALIGVLKVLVQRKSTLEFELETKDGNKLKIKADDLEEDDMTKLVEAIAKLK